MLIAFSRHYVAIAHNDTLVLMEPEKKVRIEHELDVSERIVKLECNHRGGIALTDKGRVIFFERYRRDYQSTEVITDIAASEHDTILVTREGAFLPLDKRGEGMKAVPPPASIAVGSAKIAYITAGKLYMNDQHIPHAYHVMTVAVGGGHTLFIDSEGEVYGFGNNGHGQLGRGIINYAANPVRVPFFTKARKVVAGNEHTAVLDVHGKLWICGSNARGQLGPVESIDGCRHGLAHLYDDVVDVAARGAATLILFSNGNVEEIGVR